MTTGAANRRRGKDTERKVRDHLRVNGFPFCDYTRDGAAEDRGDLSGVIDRDGDWWVVEVKGWRSTPTPAMVEGACREADVEAENSGAALWCVIARRPGTVDVGRWYVHLPMWSLYPPEYDGRTVCNLTEGALDLACITVRAWLTLVAPAPVSSVGAVDGQGEPT